LIGVLILGVVGTGFIEQIQTSILDSTRQPQQTKMKELKSKSVEGDRGALTKLTRREINLKLAQVPVFYVADCPGGSCAAAIHIDGEGHSGKIFLNIEDAREYERKLAESGNNGEVSVKAATLEEVYYPLVKKKGKIGSFLSSVASAGDQSADYALVPPSKQTKVLIDAAVSIQDNDVPLFRVPNLAFSKDELEVPLFVYQDDAKSTYDRLKKEKANSGSPPPIDEKIQVTTLNSIVQKWENGGFEGRALEIYPGMEDIEVATSLLEKSYK